MDNKFIGLMVGLTVGVLMVSGFLWPIVSDATSTETVFDNAENAQSYMEAIGSDTESYTMVLDGANNPGFLTINGINVKPNDGTLFCIKNVGLIRNHGGATDERFNSMRLEFGTTSRIVTAFNLSIINGVCTYTYDDVTTPVTLDVSSGGFGIIDKGSYVMTNANQTKYILADTEIYAQGLTGITGSAWNTQLQFNGTEENGLTYNVVYPPQNAITFSDTEFVMDEVGGYDGLYDLDKITFTATYNDTANSCTYNRIIIPAEVTAEKSWHLDTTQIAMIGVIGTLGAIVLIAAAAGSIRRLD